MAIKVSGVRCCGVEQSEHERTNADDAKARWKTWQTERDAAKPVKPGELADKPTKKPRKKGGVRRK